MVEDRFGISLDLTILSYRLDVKIRRSTQDVYVNISLNNRANFVKIDIGTFKLDFEGRPRRKRMALCPKLHGSGRHYSTAAGDLGRQNRDGYIAQVLKSAVQSIGSYTAVIFSGNP